MPDDDLFRRAVQGRVEELLSRRHNTSTSRLLVETMVEGMKLYRNYKEQEKEEQRKKRGRGEKRERRRHRKGGRMDEKKQDEHRRCHDHTHGERNDGSNNGRRHQYHDRSRNRGHRRHRDVSHGRPCSSPQGKYNDASFRVHHARSRSRDGRSNHDPRGESDNVHDSTTVSTEENNLMSGANGVQFSGENWVSQSQAQSTSDMERVVSHSRRTSSTSDQSSHTRLKTRRVPKPHNAHRRGGEKNPPPRHQSRALQRHSVTWAERSGAAQPSVQQRGPDGTPFGSLPRYESKAGIVLGLYDYFVKTYRQIKAEQDAGYRTKGLIEKALERARDIRPDGKTSKAKQGCHRKAPGQYPEEGEYEDNDNEEDRLIHPHSYALQDQDTSTPPIEEPHSPAEAAIASEPSCPTMPHAPLPPPPVVRDANNARTALLDSIQGGVRLGKVASLDKKDTSTSSSAGRVLYEATEHSQEVEALERAQAAQAAQAAQVVQVEGETDTGPEPNRAFREDLLNALEGRKTRLGRAGHVA